MTEFGLPNAVQTLLASLSATQEMSSWKVVGEKRQTIVILRFTDDPACTGNSRHDTQLQHPAYGHWRRKPLSAIRRDQERAMKRRQQLQQQQNEQQQEKQEHERQRQQQEKKERVQEEKLQRQRHKPEEECQSEDSKAMTPLIRDRKNTEASDTLETECNDTDDHNASMDTENSDTDDTLMSCDNTNENTLDHDTVAADPLSVTDCVVDNSSPNRPLQTTQPARRNFEAVTPTTPINTRETERVSTRDINREKEEKQTQIEMQEMALKAGYSLQHIRELVAAVTDKTQLQLLLDNSRNNRFRRVVYDDLRETTILESDDFILHHDGFVNRTGWFLKCLPNSGQQDLESWEKKIYPEKEPFSEKDMLEYINNPEEEDIGTGQLYRPLNAKLRLTLQDASQLVSELMQERLAQESSTQLKM